MKRQLGSAAGSGAQGEGQHVEVEHVHDRRSACL